MLRKQAVLGQPQDPIFYSFFLGATGLLFCLGVGIFYTFTKVLRHLMKFVAVFEKEVEGPFS